MKILSIINPSYKNIPALNSNLQSSPVSVQYAYNLPCDTVSFTGRSKYKGEISEDSGWVDERDMNSDAILKHLENGSYDQALKFIQGLEEKDWEPNFCVLGTDDDDEYSLMGFVLEKMSEMNEDTEKYETLRKIAGEIASHDDFEYINEVVGEDTMFTAMASFLPEVAIDIMFSKKFQDNLENIDFDKYIDIAKEEGLVDLAAELKSQSSRSKRLTESSDAAHNLSSKDENVGVLRLRVALRRYELNQNPNDPKSLDEVGGMFKAKKDIEEFIIKPWNKDFRDKIIENKLNRPSGFLLSGPPGCGKTYIMKAIAAQTGYDLYEINLANIGDSAGYKTQNDLKKLFDDLEEKYKLTGEPSILILDELDSIAMDRKNCQTDWKKDDINALLMVINNSAQRGVIVVGATNDYDALDSAVKRPGRLDKHIEITMPDYEETKDIVEKIFADRPIASGLLENSDEIAQKLKGMSPAQISSILHNACLNAIYEYKDTATMEDFEKMYEALKRDSKSAGRIRIKGFKQGN